jgi:glycosyltransferase involved in cell wall biosynthesis
LNEKISVCIINWNWLEILKQSLENLKAENAEVIVLDNGSVDGSAEWLNKQNCLKAILLKENQGSSVGRNMMIRESQGKYILLMDSDIIYIPGSLAYMVKRLSECPAQIVALGFTPWNYVCDMNKYTGKLPPCDAPMKMNGNLPFAPTQYGLFKREIFDICTFDENFGIGWGGEDDDLYRQMQKHGYDVRFVDCQYYHAKGTPKWTERHKLISDTVQKRRDYLERKWRK